MLFLYWLAGSLVRLAFCAGLALFLVAQSFAQGPERGFALVVGNSEYKAGRLPTAANDADLIAETLRRVGFDVSGARDLDLNRLRQSSREFIDKLSAAGPKAVTVVYLAGYGLQYESENYFVPIDATIGRDEDIPSETLHLSDFIRSLAGTPGAVKLIVVDAARQHPFAPTGIPLRNGLGAMAPDPGMLIAFNATPGSIALIENGPYGAFAQALAEMIGIGGLGLDELFGRVGPRVYERTNGVVMPWYTSNIARPFLFGERPFGERPRFAPLLPQASTRGSLPLPQTMGNANVQRGVTGALDGDQEAFAGALARDSFTGYDEFLTAYPDSPLAPLARAIVTLRREAMIWPRTLNVGIREAYLSYLRRYPPGAYLADAQRRIAALTATLTPPSTFAPTAFDVRLLLPDEVVFLSQPALVFKGPGLTPLLPVFLLPPLTAGLIIRAPLMPPAAGPLFPVAMPNSSVSFWAFPPAFVGLSSFGPIKQITINVTTAVNQSLGRAPPLSPALAAAVVTRINGGPPSAGAPALAPISLPAATAVAPRMPGQSPMLPPLNGLRPAGSATAAMPPSLTTMTPPLRLPSLAVPRSGGSVTAIPTQTMTPLLGPRPDTAATVTTSPSIRMPPSLPLPGVPSQNFTRPAAPPPPQVTPPPPSPQIVNRSPPLAPQNFTRPTAPPPPQVTPPPPSPQIVNRSPPLPPQNFTRPTAPPPPQVKPPTPPPQIAIRSPPPPPAVNQPVPPPVANQSAPPPAVNASGPLPAVRTPRPF